MSAISYKIDNIAKRDDIKAFEMLVKRIAQCRNDKLVIESDYQIDDDLLLALASIHTRQFTDKNKSFIYKATIETKIEPLSF